MKKLINPGGPSYRELKSLILGPQFPFQYLEYSTTDNEPSEQYRSWPHWSHTVFERPIPNLKPVPVLQSPFGDVFSRFFQELFTTNKLGVITIFRLNVNATHPSKDNRPGYPHVDHPFPHRNILVYLTDTDGDTVIVDDDIVHTPKEDEIIMFSGVHYAMLPTDGRRVVIVCTVLTEDLLC
jgi:hypothetical protein